MLKHTRQKSCILRKLFGINFIFKLKFILSLNLLTVNNFKFYLSLLLSNIYFIENGGQRQENVVYKGSLNGLNTIFLEKNAFTFVYFDKEDMANMHDFSQATESEKAKYCMKGHSYKVNFLNSKTPTIIKGIDKQKAYHNYFLGNDSKKWAKKMGVYEGIFYENLYQ